MNERYEYTIPVHFRHQVFFTNDVFNVKNSILADLVSGSRPARLTAFVDEGVVSSQPNIKEEIVEYFKSLQGRVELVGEPMSVAGGEKAKSDRRVFEAAIERIHRAGICRHSYVLAIGGGSVLDSVCFAASVVHRGVREIRVPTTVLAQNDAGIGVKNGIDAFGKKNFLGTFHPPFAVVNDSKFLTTLDDENWRNGTAEAIKVALIKDAAFFEWIEEHAVALRRRQLKSMECLIRWCAKLHLEHIATNGDPFESGSARPLDFGHWSAHKLEQLTSFRIGHGAAVATGICLDVLYGKVKGILKKQEAQRVIKCFQRLGFQLWHEELQIRQGSQLVLLEGLEEFREHLGGELSITLLDGIGISYQVSSIDVGALEAALEELRCLAQNKSQVTVF